MVESLCDVAKGLLPLRIPESDRCPDNKTSYKTHFGKLLTVSALPSSVTMTSNPRLLTNKGLYGTFSEFDEPSMSSNQAERVS